MNEDRYFFNPLTKAWELRDDTPPENLQPNPAWVKAPYREVIFTSLDGILDPELLKRMRGEA